LRYDQRQSPELWKLARHVSRPEYREHDEHLEEVLDASHVIPFSISRRLFGSLLVAARLERWQSMSAVIAGERALSLHPEEVRECHKLAVEQATADREKTILIPPAVGAGVIGAGALLLLLGSRKKK
jgi:nitroreductase